MFGRRGYISTNGAVGRAAAQFVLSRDGWTTRHVEHFELINSESARRRLTVDIRLPSHGADLGDVDGGKLYVVPAAVLGKRRPVAGINLRDEAGDSIPLLTRNENTAITQRAVCAAARRMVRQPLGGEVRTRLEQIVAGDGAEAVTAYRTTPTGGYARRVSERLVAHPDAPAFDRFVVRAILNSVLWVPIIARPGSRALIKLDYDWPVQLGTGGWGGRLLISLGLAPIEIWLLGPYIPDMGSYHLETTSPPGLEMREVQLVAPLVQRPEEKATLYLERTAHAAHIYLSGVRAQNEAAVALKMRVGRRGYVTAAAIATALITVLLAVFAVRSHPLSVEPAATVPLLLVVPTLLIIFAARREHELVTAVLRGVRALVFVAGLCSIGAALAVAGVRLFHLGLRCELIVLSAMAAACAVAVGVVWALAGRSVRREVLG